MSISRRAVSQQVLARLATVVQGKYRIERLLGVGGTAAVYAATHRNGHRVAIKFQLEHLRDDSDIRRLFSREAYVANQVGHPGAVPVLDDDVDPSGCAFLIMPLLEGETVRARWERANRRLPLAEVCTLALDVLDVLASAHAKGIVHRDIKPDNLFITTAGSVRVLDFGIARRTHIDGTATATVGMIGTPAFMPPEQATADRDSVGPASDVWAVGATMFALLSGQFVHKAEGLIALLSAAATRHARHLTHVAPDVPREITGVVDKALAFDSAERWPAAGEMQNALRLALRDAFGEPVDPIMQRVRSGFADELFETIHDRSVEKTRMPRRYRDSTPTLRELRDHESTDLRGGEQSTRARVRPLRIPFLAGITALAMSSVMAAVLHDRSGATGGANALPETVARDGSVKITSTSPEALVHFNMGIQHWRDASREEAQESFARAIELDSTLASAHLYASMLVFWIDEGARRHHQNASVHRNRLGSRDRALLDAFMPAMTIPPDLHASAKRLAEVRQSFPDDWIVLWALATTYNKIGQAQEARDVLDDLLRREPHMAVAWAARAIALVLLDDAAGTRDALQQCLRQAPYATRCLSLLAELDENEGRCLDAEQQLRTLMTLPSYSIESVSRMAGAIHGRGAALASVHDVLERAWPLAPESMRAIVRHGNESHFRVLEGAFDAAQIATDAWGSAVAKEKYEGLRRLHARTQWYLALELGARSRAVRLASEYLSKRDAWLPDTYFDGEIAALRVQYVAGGLSRDAFHKRRLAWLERDAQRPALVGSLNYRWVLAYALATVTTDDALDALRVLPNYLPMSDVISRDVEVDYGLGLVHLKAGDADTALVYLRRATQSCRTIDYPFEHTWAHFQLGMALEKKGDDTGACAAYAVVLHRWGNESRSVSAHAARARRLVLSCPTP